MKCGPPCVESLLLALLDETSEEEIRRVSETTGVPAHGAGTTGVQGTDDNAATANMDPATVFVLNPGNDYEGEDNEPHGDPGEEEEEEDDVFDDKTTTPEIPLPLDIEENLPGE